MDFFFNANNQNDRLQQNKCYNVSYDAGQSPLQSQLMLPSKDSHRSGTAKQKIVRFF